MNQKTFTQIQKSVVDKGKVDERASELKAELKEQKRYFRGMVNQYEHIIKDYKKTIQLYQQHIGKLFFVSVYNKIKAKIGGGK